ncbi:MAG: nucleotidyltransferase domain-containing protein [Calditrichaeota bacterium]|nr:MAG: nucleotidyltransferase domain-containing protein [Calditrichota bacterium]
MKLSKDQTQKITNYFQGQPVEKAYVFGSHARESANIKSDIDILVELDHSKPIGLGFVRMQLELQEILHKNVDLLSLNAVSKYIRPFVDKDKKLIYERIK